MARSNPEIYDLAQWLGERVNDLSPVGARLSVSRTHPHVFGDIPIRGHVEDITTPSDANNVYIQTRWGGGRYNVRLFRPGTGDDDTEILADEAALILAGDPLAYRSGADRMVLPPRDAGKAAGKYVDPAFPPLAHDVPFLGPYGGYSGYHHPVPQMDPHMFAGNMPYDQGLRADPALTAQLAALQKQVDELQATVRRHPTELEAAREKGRAESAAQVRDLEQKVRNLEDDGRAAARRHQEDLRAAFREGREEARGEHRSATDGLQESIRQLREDKASMQSLHQQALLQAENNARAAMETARADWNAREMGLREDMRNAAAAHAEALRQLEHRLTSEHNRRVEDLHAAHRAERAAWEREAALRSDTAKEVAALQVVQAEARGAAAAAQQRPDVLTEFARAKDLLSAVGAPVGGGEPPPPPTTMDRVVGILEKLGGRALAPLMLAQQPQAGQPAGGGPQAAPPVAPPAALGTQGTTVGQAVQPYTDAEIAEYTGGLLLAYEHIKPEDVKGYLQETDLARLRSTPDLYRRALKAAPGANLQFSNWLAAALQTLQAG